MRVTVVSFLLVISMAGASSFVYEYSAASGVMPQESSPNWGLRHGGGLIQLRDDRLTAETPVKERNFFAIGVLDDGKKFGFSSAWDGATRESTVEFRVRCESTDPELEIFQVQISNGALQWRIRFFAEKIFPRDVAVNIGEIDTYRAVIKDNKMTLISDRQGVLFFDLPGSDTYAGKPTRSNALLFGSFSPNSQIEGGVGVWELDFIRWTNKAATTDPLVKE